MALLTFFLFPTCCFATGWTDFELAIGDGYRIVKGNSIDVMVCNENHRVILLPRAYPDVGPIVRYSTTDRLILTRNIGRKPRNLFKGDGFQDPDRKKEFFFIITKESDEVNGPLSRSEFERHPFMASVSPLDWKVPRNPHIIRSLIAFLYVICMSVFLCIVGYSLVCIPVFLFFGVPFIFAIIIRKCRKC